MSVSSDALRSIPLAVRLTHRLRAWWGGRLRRKIMLAMLAASALASVLLLVSFFAVYRGQLAQQRVMASMEVNRLFQATLEGAMAGQDSERLVQTMAQMRQQQGVLDVRILDQSGRVHFASDTSAVGALIPLPKDVAPVEVEGVIAVPFQILDAGRDVLRSFNPVNRSACVGCHTDYDAQWAGGLLVVDHDARTIRSQARGSALALTFGAALVMLLSCVVGYRALRRYVMVPVDALADAAQRLSEGDHSVRVVVDGEDELAELGRTFNRMAANLETTYLELNAQHRYLRSLLDSLPDAVRVIAPDYRVLAVNSAYCKLLGLNREAALGQHCYQTHRALKEPCPPTLSICPLHALSDDQPMLKYEERLMRVDGAEVTVETVATRILLEGAEGPQACVVESLRDLSTLARYSQEQRLSEIGMLAAGIAHEIHNPLASVRLAVQSLTRSAAENTLRAGEMEDSLALVDGEIDRCIEVTRRLLMLCRHPNEILQSTDVNHAMHDAAMLLSYDALEGGIEQVEDFAPEAPCVNADPSELRMVIFNMVQNAHHAMPDGGRVRLMSRVEGEQVVIEVVDTGVGISAENIGRIFQPFYSLRADGVMGTGLGLSIVRSTVSRYNGTIDVASEPGKGACFTIRLPLIDTAGSVGSLPEIPVQPSD